MTDSRLEALVKCAAQKCVQIDASPMKIISEVAQTVIKDRVDEITMLRDAILDGEKRWTKAEKLILKIMDVKNLEYYVLYCKEEHAADKLNDLVKQRWEVKHANCENSAYCATLVRRKL